MNTPEKPTPQPAAAQPAGTDAPETIWLQWHGDADPDDPDAVTECEVTWSRESIFMGDICYKRVAPPRPGPSGREPHAAGGLRERVIEIVKAVYAYPTHELMADEIIRSLALPSPPTPPPSQPLPWMREAREEWGLVLGQYADPRAYGVAQMTYHQAADKIDAIIAKHAPSPVAAHGGHWVLVELQEILAEKERSYANQVDCGFEKAFITKKHTDAIKVAIAALTAPPLQPAQPIPCQTAEESRVGAARVAANNPAIKS